MRAYSATSSGLVTTPDNSGAIALQNAGVTGLNLDASGRMTLPLQPAFQVYSPSDFTVSATDRTSFTTQLSIASYNYGGNYSTSTGRFTAPIPGVYLFNVKLYLGNVGNTSYNGFELKKNGNYIYSLWTPGNSDTTPTGSVTMLLAANDYIQLNAYCAGTVTVYGGVKNTFFEGRLVQ